MIYPVEIVRRSNPATASIGRQSRQFCQRINIQCCFQFPGQLIQRAVHAVGLVNAIGCDAERGQQAGAGLGLGEQAVDIGACDPAIGGYRTIRPTVGDASNRPGAIIASAVALIAFIALKGWL